MKHKNFFTFKADTNYDLGFLMGKKFSKEAQAAILAAKNNNWINKSNIGKKLLDSTQNYLPQFIDELKGYAAGANVDFLDLWTISIEGDTEIKNNQTKCTSVITNQGKLIGHNEDADNAGLENSVCLVKKILKNITTFEVFYFNTLGGNSIGISSFGYVHTINTLFGTENKLGIPKNVLARFVFETENPNKTIQKILDFKRASGYNHNIVYKNGKIWNLELTANEGILVNPSSPFVHSNHGLNIKSEFIDKNGTITRLEHAQNKIKNTATVDELINLLEDVSYGPIKSIFNERTIAKMIVDFNLMIMKVWLKREKSMGWVNYPIDFVE